MIDSSVCLEQSSINVFNKFNTFQRLLLCCKLQSIMDMFLLGFCYEIGGQVRAKA